MTTNRAFIKAYRHDAAQPAPAAPLSSSMRSAESLLAASVEYVSVAPTQRAEIYATSATIGMSGAPVVDVSPSSAGVEARQAASPREPNRIAIAGHISRPATGKRPLSAFTAARQAPSTTNVPPPAGRTTNIPASATAFRPGTTIASFRWPPICRALSQQCGKQFDDLADVLLAKAENGRSLVGFVSLFPGRGCTTTLLATAARLAARAQRIVIADGNFCRPQLAGLVDNELETSWYDVLVSGIPVADAIVRALDDGVDLLPFVPPLHAMPTAEWAARLHAPVTAGVLRHAYDLALVDLGSFFDPELQPINMELVRNMRLDSVLAVVGPQPADPRDLDTLSQHLTNRGCSLIGTIENRFAKHPALGCRS